MGAARTRRLGYTEEEEDMITQAPRGVQDWYGENMHKRAVGGEALPGIWRKPTI